MIDRKGNIIGKYEEKRNLNDKVLAKVKDDSHAAQNNPNYESVKSALTNEEGCQVYGNISVLKVPGNFHISSHSFAQIISKLAVEGFYKFDLSHTINHISFGEEDDIKQIKSKFNVGILNPIDNTSKSNSTNKKMIYEYYLKVVPTTYIDLSGNQYNVHQFTANNNEMKANMMVPAIFFRYDLSPILVKYTQTRERIFVFFIEICAIIGGIYMVTSVILTFIINSTAMFYKNKEK